MNVSKTRRMIEIELVQEAKGELATGLNGSTVQI